MVRTNFILAVIITASLIVAYIVGELVYVRYAGTAVPAPSIPRTATNYGIGQGTRLRYVVMGDSTAISQGSDYSDGFAVQSAQHIAKSQPVALRNTGISGATTAEVAAKQLKKAVAFKPDLVLLSVGANDAKNFTSTRAVKNSVQKIIDGLRKENPDVKIVVTGSPAMDSVSRFPPLAKRVMAYRTAQINRVFTNLAAKNNLTVAPIAKETRADFLADPTLTASDKFHPNKRGYALWIPVINTAVDKATASTN